MSDFEETPTTEKDWKKMDEAVEEGRRRHPNSPATLRGIQWEKEQLELERKAGHKLPPH